MMIDKMKEGKRIWFTEREKDEDGRFHSVGREGLILSFDKNNVSVMGADEQEHNVKPYNCYESEKEMSFDLKMNQFTENFSDMLEGVARKYMDGCRDVVKNNVLKMTPGKEMIVNDMKMKLQMLGMGFKEQVSSMTGSFVDRTQRHTSEYINDTARDLMLHTDLSQYEPGGINLAAKDLEGLSDDGISLSDADLDGIEVQDIGLKL